LEHAGSTNIALLSQSMPIDTARLRKKTGYMSINGFLKIRKEIGGVWS